MRDGSDRINELFERNLRDLTPLSARHAAQVLYVPMIYGRDASSLWQTILQDTELQRAHRFAAESDRARFEQRRAFRRYCGAAATGSTRPLSEIVFEETDSGRPYLRDSPSIWFSFSSCRLGMLGAWSPTHGIGVDVEDRTRNVEVMELARAYFSAPEAETLEGLGGPERRRTFFQLWNLKEAALKSIGEGLPFGLGAFQFELAPRLRVVQAPAEHGGPGRFDSHLLEGIEACAALVIRRYR